jgi:hypothetical protein
MSKIVLQSDKWGRGLLAFILSSAVEWCWLRSRAALPCSDEASGRSRAMMNHWLPGWLAGGPRWSWGGCDWCWVLLQDAWRAVVCPVHEATWPGSRALYLLSWWVLSWCVCCRLLLSEWTAFRSSQAKPSQTKPNQSVNWGAETWANPLSVNHCCVWPHSWV